MTSPAGWFADPQNPTVSRYWDGAQWTTRTRPNSLAVAPVSNRPQRKNGWVQYLLLGVIVLVGGITISALRSDSDDPRASTASSALDSPTADKDRTLLDATTFQEITSRELSLYLKDPERHAGQRLVLYGTVRQFDSVTGPESFLANVSAVPNSEVSETESALIYGDKALLGPIVEGDTVKMHVKLLGTMSYENAVGGEMTLPSFSVHIAEVTG